MVSNESFDTTENLKSPSFFVCICGCDVFYLHSFRSYKISSPTCIMESSLRLDLWLFYARLYKSRTKATEACKNGRIMHNGSPANASDEVSVGDSIRIREKGIYRQYEVLEIPPKNLSKEEAKQVYEDVTPMEVLERFKAMREDAFERRKSGKPGSRPTKKERRKIDRSRGRF